MNITMPNNSVIANGQSTGTLPMMRNAYTGFQMLVRAIPHMVTEKWGQTFVMPANETKVAKFRRFEALDPALTALTEGVTPASVELTVTDLSVPLIQYGSVLTLTDVLLDTNDYSVLTNATAVVGEQAAETIELIRLGVLLGGTNVEYANGTALADVNTPLSLQLQRRIVRKLKAQKARQHTEFVSSTPSFNTENVAPSFVGICHTDCEADIRDMPGFQDVKDYGSTRGLENEIGAVEGVRYFYTTLMEPQVNAGGAASGGGGTLPPVMSDNGVKANVYPILYIAKDAYGIIPFKGMTAVTPSVVPAAPSSSDPLGQRSHIGWKTMQAAVILNQAWMVRAMVAVSKM